MLRTLLILLISVCYLQADQMKLRFKCLSVPIEMVHKINPGLLPGKYGKFKKKMTNAEFEAFLKELHKDERVFSLFDSRDQVISGKTYQVRNIEEKLLPESYDAVFEEVRGEDEESGKVIGFGPQYGKAREVGLAIEATPQLEPDGVTISVDYKPQLLNFEGMASYSKEAKIEMSVLRVLTQETRCTIKMDQTIMSMCVFERNISQTAKVVLDKEKANQEQCLMLFISAEGNPKINPPIGESSELFYSSSRIEVNKSFAKKLIKENKKYLTDDDIKNLRQELEHNKAKILTVNSGITQNGSTAVTRNVLEVYLPESFEHYNVKGKQLKTPNFGDPRDLGSVLEYTAQIDPDGERIEFEMKEEAVSISKWTVSKMQDLNVYALDNRFKTKSGKVLLLNNSLKKNGFQKPVDNKVIINIFYTEIQ